MRCLLSTVLLAAILTADVRAHDIPNAQVDRSIQVTLRPGRLEVDYEVGLAELTLTQDLRALTGTLPGGDRQDWFDRYGRVTGPLNAKGLLVAVDGRSLDLQFLGFDLAVEEHPRYTFHFATDLPARGRLTLQDTNYVASEGTSRLALRRLGGVATRGDELPEDVRNVPIRPVWQLTDAEERHTKQFDVEFGPAEAAPAARRSPPNSVEAARSPAPPPRGGTDRLSRLLDRATSVPLWGLCAMALALGAAHSIQPGHGKTLVAASAVGERNAWPWSVALALVITLAHMAGVLAVALALWATRSTRYADINQGLAHVAGFTIAAIGLWRLGRYLAGYGEHDEPKGPAELGSRGLIGLGVAGGLVPCWDAVVLIVLAEALGRLGLGLLLLSAFSIGMAAVLVTVGVVAARLRGLAISGSREGIWERRLGIGSALVLTAIGLYLFVL